MAENSNVLQIALDPSIFAANLFQVIFDEENFYITVITGNQGRRYQLTPKHAKRLSMLLQKKIGEYEEKQNLKIEANLPKVEQGQAEQTSERKIGFQGQL